jgi:hypothetical protein
MDDDLLKDWARPTPAACFKTYVEMHLLGSEQPGVRMKSAQLCLYAWDIALLPDRVSRDQQIERMLRHLTPATRPKDTDEWFVREMRDLVSRKRQFLPSLNTLIRGVKLESVEENSEQLSVTTDAGIETFSIDLVDNRTIAESLGRRLNRIRSEIDDLQYALSQRQLEGGLSEEEKIHVSLACGLKRLELFKYHEMTITLSAIQVAPAPKRVTAEWVRMTKEIEQQVADTISNLDMF